MSRTHADRGDAATPELSGPGEEAIYAAVNLATSPPAARCSPEPTPTCSTRCRTADRVVIQVAVDAHHGKQILPIEVYGVAENLDPPSARPR